MNTGQNPSNIDPCYLNLPSPIRRILQENIHQEDHGRHHRSTKVGCTKRRDKFHKKFHKHARKKH